MSSFFLVSVLMFSMLLSVNSYTPCLELEPTHIDPNWLVESGKSGYHIVLHSRCNNCENEENWKWITGRGAGQAPPKKLCWKVDGDTKLTANGKLKLSFHCEYTDRIEVQNCFSDFSTTQFQGISLGGKNIITHTDNSTYLAGTSCMFGKENFWWVASHVPEEVKESTLEELHNSFREKGFSAVTATLEHGAPVILKKFTMGPC